MVEEKNTKKGSGEYAYWMTSWGWKKVRNVHLGSCRKLLREEAPQKARNIKAERLGKHRCTIIYGQKEYISFLLKGN